MRRTLFVVPRDEGPVLEAAAAREIARRERKRMETLLSAELDGDRVSGFLADLEADPVPAAGPHSALLPALDPTPMGWTKRDWFLGPHAPRLFDRNGNAGPTVWVDGRVVGGWAQRPDG